MKKYLVLLALVIGCASPESPQPQSAVMDFSGTVAWYKGDTLQWNLGVPSNVSLHLSERDSLFVGVMYDSTKFKTFPINGFREDQNTYKCQWGGVGDTNTAVFSGGNLTISGRTFPNGLISKVILHE